MRHAIGFDSTAFRGRLAANFPDADMDDYLIVFGPIHLRFELGAPHPNGSAKRVEQAAARAAAIFRDLFPPEEPLTLIVNSWEWTGRETFPSSPGCLSSLLGPRLAEGATRFVGERDPDSDTIGHEQTLLPAIAGELDCRAIFLGLANREQGREPKIGEDVYFLNAACDRVFRMYDDRGCLIHATRPEHLAHLYEMRRNWLVNPDDEFWSATFGGAR